MRTTLVIPDTVYHRAKQAAQEQGCTLSELFTESVEIRLSQKKKGAEKPYQIKPVSMGIPKADPNDREALYRAMEE